MTWRPTPPMAVVGLSLLALAATATGLTNGFALDDVFIVRDNPSVQDLQAPWTYGQESYWQTHYCCAMYRPFTIWAFALEWAIGGGAPWVFHAVNVLLAVGTTIGVFWLLRQVTGFGASFLGAAFFASHPIRTEAVANVVGQAELWVGLCAVIAVGLFIRARKRGAISTHTQLTIVAITALGSLAKEQAFIIPLLLAMAEWTLIDTHETIRARYNAHRHLVLGLALVLTAILWARFAVLNGLGAGPEFVVFRDSSLVERVLIVLSVVPEWARLLLFPLHLRADYGPPEHGIVSSAIPRIVLGALLLVGVLTLIAISRRRVPALALGLGWVVVAILPVSNIPFVTGVLIAERTLYLPSAGIAFVIAATITAIHRHWSTLRGLPQVVTAGLIALVAANTVQSALRQPIWRDNETLFNATLRDAPANYRSHRYYARHLVTDGRPTEALPYFARAMDLYPDDPQIGEDLAQILRQAGRCGEAVTILERVLERDATRVPARAKLYNCLLETGDVERARVVASDGAAMGDAGFAPLRDRADSMLGRSIR